MQELFGDKQFLIKLSKAKMPFGKYKDTYLSDLPEYYMIWYKNKGFPKGQIGEMTFNYKIARIYCYHMRSGATDYTPGS